MDSGNLDSLNALLVKQPQVSNTPSVGDTDSLHVLLDKDHSLMQNVKAAKDAALLGSNSFIDTVLTGLSKGSKKLAELTGVKALELGVTPDMIKETHQIDQKRYDNYKTEGYSPAMLGTSKFAGEMLPWLAAPVASPAAGAGLAARAGLAGLQGALYGGASAGLNYNPETTPENLFNVDAAKSGALLGGGLGAGLGGLLGFAGKTDALKKAEDAAFGAKVFMRDVTGGKPKEIWDKFIGAIPLIGDKSDRLTQEASFVPAIQNYIKSLSSKVASNPLDDSAIASQSGQVVEKAYNRIHAQESNLWNKVTEQGDFNVTPGGLKATQDSMKSFIDKYGNDLLADSKFKIQDLINLDPSKTTFNQVQKIKSQLGNTEQKLWKREGMGNIDRDVVMEFKDIVNSLKDNLGESALSKGGDVSNAYIAANEFTKHRSQLFDEGGRQLKNAIEDNAMGYNFLQKLLTEKNPKQIQRMTDMFTPDELGQIRGLAVAKHFNDSITEIKLPEGATLTKGRAMAQDGTPLGTKSNWTYSPDEGPVSQQRMREGGFVRNWSPTSTGIDVNKFLGNIQKDKTLETLLGSDNYVALNGLRKVMMDNQSAKQAATSMQGPMGNIGTAAAVGGAAATAGINTVAPIVISLKVANKIAAASPIKNMLINLERANPGSSAYKFFSKALPKAMFKAGIINNENGLVHSSETQGN